MVGMGDKARRQQADDRWRYPLSGNGAFAGKSTRSPEGQRSCSSIPRKSEMQHLNRRSRLPVQFVATWHALIAANGPFLRAVNRMFTFPLGEWRLRSDHAAHECESFGHRRVGHDFLNAHRLGAGTEQMAHHGNDGHEQCSLSPISSGAEI